MDAQEPDSEPSHEMKVGSGVGEPHLACPIGARTAHVDGGTGRDPGRCPGHPLRQPRFIGTSCWASLVAQIVKNLPAMQETRV